VSGYRKWITPEHARDAILRGTGRGVRIAVLDSGIETNHPALAGIHLRDDIAIVRDGVQLCAVPGDGKDVYGHGTAVAGILRQIAPEAEIGSIRVLGEQLQSRTALIREGAREAIERGYQILNCSFGCGWLDHVLQYKSWVDEAYVKNVHVVAACNNTDCTKAEWPAHFPSVISVDTAPLDDETAFFYRPGGLVEFVAHGVNVHVAWRDGSTKEISGSSFAVPRIAGILARILSAAPELPPTAAKALLHHLARPWNPGAA
jgi:subtilisin family serine protease